MQGTWENGSFVLASTKDDKIARLETTISRLLRYAYHEEECAVITTHCGPMQPCDCGYDTLMKEIGE